MSPSSCILIIGAGPAGLWTAIQIKILMPEIDVVIYERYTEYRRKHVLRLSKYSMRGAVPHPGLQALISRIPSIIRTSTLELDFKDLAKELNIKIVYEPVQDIHVLVENLPTRPLAVVGADGSHSILRTQMFNDSFSIKEDLSYIVEIKYEVIGEVRKMERITEFYPTQKLFGFPVIETIGKNYKKKDEEEGPLVTSVTIRFVVNKSIYESVKEATFKNPYRFPQDQEKIPTKLLEAINTWLNARAYCTNEQRIQYSERISALHLAVYISKKVTYWHENLHFPFFLVGDAAFGVPFYRALNNGLLCGSKLAYSLKDYLLSLQGHENTSKCFDKSAKQDALQRYEAYVQNLAYMEIKVAKAKSAYLVLYKIMNKINSTSPLQVNYWSKACIDLFKQNLYVKNEAKEPTETYSASEIGEFDWAFWEHLENDFDEDTEKDVSQKVSM